MIRHTASMTDAEGTPVVGPPHHLAWISIYKSGTLENHPRVAAYVSLRLRDCHPRVHRNLADHRDLQLLSVTIGGVEYFLLNVYSDDRATGIQWLDLNWDSLSSLCWMGRDFNCRDERWDPLVRRNINGDKLLAVAEGLGLRISLPPARIPTRLPWGDLDAIGSVIDLVFVPADSPADLVHAVLDLEQDSSDHAPLQVTIP